MPSAWGHTRLLETDWRLITQESHCFSCGSVKEDLMRTMRGGIFGSGLKAVRESRWISQGKMTSERPWK